MKKEFSDQIIIDGLQYCNWNRELFEDVWKGGLTAIHATLVYWENTEESFEKIKEWDLRFKENKDIICHAKTTNDILEAKKNNKVAIIFGFQNSAPIANDIFLLEKLPIFPIRKLSEDVFKPLLWGPEPIKEKY